MRGYVGGIDANAHFDTEHLPMVGSCGLEERANFAGECFTRLLAAIQGMLPTTFADCHSGETGTWHSNANGEVARCDYFILPQTICLAQVCTYPNSCIDSGAKGLDHVPLALDLEIHQMASRSVRRPSFDRNALQKADKAELERIFANPPKCPWGMHVDQHAMAVTSWVRERLVASFPCGRKGPRKSYISDDTWNVRKKRLHVRARLQNLKAWAVNLTLHHAWKCWRGHTWLQPAKIAFDGLQLIFQILALRSEAASLSRSLCKGLKFDRTKVLEAIGEQAGTLNAKAFAAELRKWGVHSRRKQTSVLPLPLVKGVHGEVLETTEQVAERWRSHFADQEDGVPMTPQQLIHMNEEIPRRKAVLPCWDQLPTLAELEQALRNTASGKAFFYDEVPGDVLRQLPALFAQVLFPLFLKETVWQREALLFKGGRLVPMFKKGSPSDCRNFRSLFVSSPIGKLLHGIYRQELGRWFDCKRLPLQIGGLKGQTTVQASHTLHLSHSIAIRRQNSFAILFIDIQNAFYRLLRGHITTSLQDTRDVRAMFRSMHLPDEVFEEFRRHFVEGPVLDDCTVSAFHASLFREFYEATWFAVEGCQKLTWTRRGSRPGDSLADISFGFALSKILGNIERLLTERFPFLNLSWNGSRSPHPDLGADNVLLGPVLPIWADDISLAFWHPSPTVMCEVIPQICNLVLHHLATAGLTPNMARGKTELFLEVRGAGAVDVKRQLSRQDNTFRLESDLISEPLLIVGHYKHLGTIIQKRGSMVRDLSSKFAVAHDVLTRFRTQIFCNRKLSLTHKSRMVKSLVYSTMIFNCAVWAPRTAKQQRQMEAGFTKLEKRIAVMHYGADAIDWSGSQARAALNLPASEVILREARLRYIAQLIRSGQPHVWSLLQEEKSWFGKVADDLVWLQSFCPEDQVPNGTPEEWEHLCWWANERPKAWKSLIRRAVERAKAHAARVHEWRDWHKAIVVDLIEAGLIGRDVASRAHEEFFCAKCRLDFASKSAVAVHSFKCHGRVNLARHYVEGLQCKGCLKHYSSNINLINHVKRKPRCLQSYAVEPCMLDPAPGLNSRIERKNDRDMADPYFQAEGPVQPVSEAMPFDPIIDAEKFRLSNCWAKRCVQELAKMT